MSIPEFHIEDISEARQVLSAIGLQIASVHELYVKVADSVAANAPSWRGEDQAVFVAAMNEYADKAKKIAACADSLLVGANKDLDKYEAIGDELRTVKGVNE